MYKKVSIKIIIILVTAAIVTVLSLALQVSYAQTNQDLANSILAVHNSERALVGVPPLTWNDNLAAGAQTWAQHIATTGQFVHDPVNAVPAGPYGENIAGFIMGVSEPKGGQYLWANEKSNYHGGPYNGDAEIGHYIQMVWHDTREIGCGTSPPGAGGLHYNILVCRYNPPGGYPGQYPYPQPR